MKSAFPRVVWESRLKDSHYRLVLTPTTFVVEMAHSNAMGEPSWLKLNVEPRENLLERRTQDAVLWNALDQLSGKVSDPRIEAIQELPRLVTAPISSKPEDSGDCDDSVSSAEQKFSVLAAAKNKNGSVSGVKSIERGPCGGPLLGEA